MPSLSEYYITQFGFEGTHGLGSIFPAIIGLIALVWMASLSFTGLEGRSQRDGQPFHRYFADCRGSEGIVHDSLTAASRLL